MASPARSFRTRAPTLPRLSLPLVLSLLLLAWAAVAANSAWAQAFPHGKAPGPRPLQVRLPLASAVAIAEVDTVGVARVRLRTLVVASGTLGEEFSIKCSPVRPPDLAAGEIVVALLVGARDPYLLVDEAEEVQRLVGPAELERWRDALPALSARISQGEDPDALLALYATWLDGPSDSLRNEALRTLTSGLDGFTPLPKAFSDERATVALDRNRAAPVRDASAFLASLDAAATARLLDALPERGDEDAAGPLRAALRSGALLRLPSTREALLRGLQHDRASVRVMALGSARGFASDPGVRAVLETLAVIGPDEESRTTAARVLDRAARTSR